MPHLISIFSIFCLISVPFLLLLSKFDTYGSRTSSSSISSDPLVSPVLFYRILSSLFHVHSNLTELFRSSSYFSSGRERESNFPQLQIVSPLLLAATFIGLASLVRVRPKVQRRAIRSRQRQADNEREGEREREMLISHT